MRLKKLFRKALRRVEGVRDAPKDFISCALMGIGITAYVLDAANPWLLGETILMSCLAGVIARGHKLTRKRQEKRENNFWQAFENATTDQDRLDALLRYAVAFEKSGILMPRRLAKGIKNPSVEIVADDAAISYVEDTLERMVSDPEGFALSALQRLSTGCSKTINTIPSRRDHRSITYALSYQRT